MNAPKIIVIGIGENGLEGLSPAARTLVDGADLLVGGERHLAKVPDGKADRLDWSDGLDHVFDRIQERLEGNIVVLASGDPSHFGVATSLIPRLGIGMIRRPISYGLAIARGNRMALI